MKNMRELFYVVKKNSLPIFVIFLLAFVFRILYLPQGSLSFAYDQARDAFLVEELLSGDIKVLGPPVSGIPGLYHGVLYYYLIAPFYFLGGGNPIVPAYFLAFINSLGVVLAFVLSYVLIKKTAASFVAATLFAFSFEASQYANLLTNVSLASVTLPLTYIFLIFWARGKISFSLWAGFAFGISIQSEIALLYHLIPICLFYFFSKKFAKIKSAAIFIIGFFMGVIPMIVSEVRFGFTGLSGMWYLLTRADGVAQERDLLDILVIYFDQVSETFANNIIPVSHLGGGIIFLATTSYSLYLVFKKKAKLWNFLPFAIAPHLFVLPFGGTNIRHIMVGAGVLITSLVGIVIYKLFRKMPYAAGGIVAIIISVNLVYIFTNNNDGQTIFPLQKDLTLANELKVVDYTYKEAGGLEFSINTITSPLWVNTLWSYIYNLRGQSEYGYLPKWSGKDQIGQLGNNLQTNLNIKTTFLIIEPTYGIPERFISETINEENARGRVLEEISFGDIIVQKREAFGVK